VDFKAEWFSLHFQPIHIINQMTIDLWCLPILNPKDTGCRPSPARTG